MFYVDIIIGEYQIRFTGDSPTTDKIYTVRQIAERFGEFNIDLYKLFEDVLASWRLDISRGAVLCV